MDEIDEIVELIGSELKTEMDATFRNPEIARDWLQRPVPAFGGATPSWMIRTGKAEEVLSLLRRLNLGFPM
jgi:uncharacterized protein (DUF2384 family)